MKFRYFTHLLPMRSFVMLIVALCAVENSFVAATNARGISYEDLQEVNFTCYPKDSCAEGRIEEYQELSGYFNILPQNYSCSCDRMCSKLGTCCIDSPYRHVPRPAVMPNCRSVGGFPNAFYMVDKCEEGGDYSPIWREWCEEELVWRNDMRMIAPVTSLATSITYKNYYCLRCHETTNAFLYWEAKLTILYGYKAEYEEGIPNTEVTYDRESKTWQAEGADGRTFDAIMAFQIPMSIRSLALVCDVSVVSNCPDNWVDEDVRNLCSAYMAVAYTSYFTGVYRAYRNAHCALCNSELLEYLECEAPRIGGGYGGGFSLDCIFNMNARTRGCGLRSERKVDIDNDKIRVENCIVPHYVIKNGKCVPP